MGIWVKRLPKHGVTVVIWSGRVALDEVRRHFGALEAAYTDRWLQYWDSSVDMSGVDVSAIPELKRLLAVKLNALYGGRRAISAIVCEPGTLELFPEFWTSYASVDPAYPAEVKVFASLEDACEWLNLPPDGRRAVFDAVEGSGSDTRGSESGSGKWAPGPAEP